MTIWYGRFCTKLVANNCNKQGKSLHREIGIYYILVVICYCCVLNSNNNSTTQRAELCDAFLRADSGRRRRRIYTHAFAAFVIVWTAEYYNFTRGVYRLKSVHIL